MASGDVFSPYRAGRCHRPHFPLSLLNALFGRCDLLKGLAMKYAHITAGTFLSRPNRFIAHVMIGSQDTLCHVKNTGRCKELLRPGVQVILAVSDNPLRKTRHDLIAVYKQGILINMDSQAPNQAAHEWLQKRFPDALSIRPECTHGDSRFDFCVQTQDAAWFIEVKGVTLEINGHALFPDAPTQRGSKHLRGLMHCVKEGHKAAVLFVVQMQGVTGFSPNQATDPAFARTLREARDAGVAIWCMDCLVTPDEMTLHSSIPVQL